MLGISTISITFNSFVLSFILSFNCESGGPKRVLRPSVLRLRKSLNCSFNSSFALIRAFQNTYNKYLCENYYFKI